MVHKFSEGGCTATVSRQLGQAPLRRVKITMESVEGVIPGQGQVGRQAEDPHGLLELPRLVRLLQLDIVKGHSVRVLGLTVILPAQAQVDFSVVLCT